MLIRVRFKKLGGHYHCRVFSRVPPHITWEGCGTLVFRENEWPSVRALMSNNDIEFLDENEEKGGDTTD